MEELLKAIPLPFHQILQGFAALFGGLAAGSLLKWIIFRFLKLYNRHGSRKLIESVITHLDRPLSYFMPLLAISLVFPLIPLNPKTYEVLRRIVEISLTCTFAWLLINGVYVVEDQVRVKFQVEKTDNLKERRLITQLQFIKRMVMVFIVFFAVSLILMSFATVRKIGTGLLTSAGIAGAIIGFAAQRSLANFLAGLQIAFSQPIRIDDVLVVENEWGRVEEITLTYVVVRIWDQRRLILPLNYFIEKPFQNWSRTTTELLGTVFLYLDYTVPIDALRTELNRILPETPLWDGRVGILQVTESKERTLELRILVSATNSPNAFDLRCYVREKMVDFVQKHYPNSLPQTRTLLPGGAAEIATNTGLL